jgi:hypothetical protein
MSDHLKAMTTIRHFLKFHAVLPRALDPDTVIFPTTNATTRLACGVITLRIAHPDPLPAGFVPQ